MRCRRICFAPDIRLFKPAGVPTRYLEEVTLSMDELEALRLVDLDGRYQDGAAMSMGVSRPTLSRIVAEGRRKVAEALVQGKALRVEGGEVRVDTGRESRPIAERCARRGSRSRRTCRRVPDSGGDISSNPLQTEGEKHTHYNEKVVEEQ
jgi:predicted DNA-binding protein (UPF0251 family)